MTKKDYIIIANTINNFIATSTADGYQVPVSHCLNLIESLAHSMQLDNPRFDKSLFIEACIKNTSVKLSDF